MRNYIILTILIGIVLISGCLDQKNDGTTVDSLAIHVIDISQINEALANGPVLVKIGADRCPPCVEMTPIINSLSGEYEGRVTAMYIDADESFELSNFFNVGYIPDTFVIVGVEDDQYVYMGTNGFTSTRREDVKLIGLLGNYTPGLINKQKIFEEKGDRFEKTKSELAERLNNAIEYNNK